MVQQTVQMQMNWIKVELNLQNNQQVANIVTATMAQSLKVEDGIIAIHAATEQDQPNKWLFFEIYADDATYDTHRQTPHFNDYLKQTEKMVVDKQMIEIIPAYLDNQDGLHFRTTQQ